MEPHKSKAKRLSKTTVVGAISAGKGDTAHRLQGPGPPHGPGPHEAEDPTRPRAAPPRAARVRLHQRLSLAPKPGPETCTRSLHPKPAPEAARVLCARSPAASTRATATCRCHLPLPPALPPALHRLLPPGPQLHCEHTQAARSASSPSGRATGPSMGARSTRASWSRAKGRSAH